jgi:citrate synthase
MDNAKLTLEGNEYELPVIKGSENEVGVDITALRGASGAVTLDPGYGNSGSCKSTITFINGEKGILRYRGYPIENLCDKASFEEVCQLLMYDKRLSSDELAEWRRELVLNSFLHDDMLNLIESFPLSAHPMVVLSSMMASLPAFFPNSESEEIEANTTRLLAQACSIACFQYKRRIGQPIIYPRTGLSYAANFLRMMFANPAEEYEVSPVLEKAVNLLFIVHADHEQNCSTSTVRMAGSSQADFYASIATGVCALWGPLHGGANQAVLEMLTRIHEDPDFDYRRYVEMAKDKNSDFRLMGFGHRVYKNFDPRATILKKACDDVLSHLGITDPLLEIAKQLEQVALEDDYFIERNLYPNVDFYSGIIYRALNIPTDMFTVLFALGRMPGWIAHWKEMREEGAKIHRPRQIYMGATEQSW